MRPKLVKILCSGSSSCHPPRAIAISITKVIHFILDERKKQKKTHLQLGFSRDELAASLGIPRPSLSRELVALKSAGLIDFNRREIEILDEDALEDVLSEQHKVS